MNSLFNRLCTEFVIMCLLIIFAALFFNLVCCHLDSKCYIIRRVLLKSLVISAPQRNGKLLWPFFPFRHCWHPLCGQTSYLTSPLSPNNNVCVCVWKVPKAVIIASSWVRFNGLLPLCVFSRCVSLAVFLRSHKSLESVDPQFTMRRKMEQLREELELMEQLREVERRQFNVQWLVIKGKLQSAITLCVVCTVSLTGCQWLNPSY